jgi:hypothetical protein
MVVRIITATTDHHSIMATIELGTYLHGDAVKYHDCIEACAVCLIACEMCSDACLGEDDVTMMVTCIRLDRDCAEACAAALRVMAHNGRLAPELCRAGAAACDACATECEKHASRMDHCRICAEACRACAEECRKMAA